MQFQQFGSLDPETYRSIFATFGLQRGWPACAALAFVFLRSRFMGCFFSIEYSGAEPDRTIAAGRRMADCALTNISIPNRSPGFPEILFKALLQQGR
jgi:hypothetical protein